MSQTFKTWGCVPATHEGVEGLNYRYLLRCSLRSASHK